MHTSKRKYCRKHCREYIVYCPECIRQKEINTLDDLMKNAEKAEQIKTLDKLWWEMKNG